MILPLLLAACNGGAPEEQEQRPEPRKVDLSAFSPEQIVDAVLQECHGPLRGGMDRAVLYVGEPGAEPRVACLALPHSLRLERPAGGTWIANGDQLWECAAGEPARDMQGETRVWMMALREVLDAATLGPLTRATASERIGPSRLRLSQKDGSTWVLELREDTLLPAALEGPGGTTRFVEYLRTSVTWIPERIRHDDTGALFLRFEQHDVHWDELFFVDPESRHESARRPLSDGRRLTIGAEHRPTVPEPGENKAMFWLVLDDPGDWPARARLFRERWSALEELGQNSAGFVAYCREGDRELMVIPFRPAQEGRPFVRPKDWEVRRKPREQVLVVYPRTGDLGTRIEEGTRLLRQSVGAQGLHAAGPVCSQPYLRLDEAVPEPADLEDVVVRMSVAVR